MTKDQLIQGIAVLTDIVSHPRMFPLNPNARCILDDVSFFLQKEVTRLKSQEALNRVAEDLASIRFG